MPEYFDISLIVKKTDQSKQKVKLCLAEKFGLHDGTNNIEYFQNKEILLSCFEDEGRNFDEFLIGFSELKFHKKEFNKELKIFVSFINICFECCEEIEYAVCSYELNGYLLSHAERFEDFNDELLNKFPIAFKREKEKEYPILLLNLQAQEIFV